MYRESIGQGGWIGWIGLGSLSCWSGLGSLSGRSA